MIPHSHRLVCLLVVLIAFASPASSSPHSDLLPRPLVLELPSSGLANSSGSGGDGDGGTYSAGDGNPTRQRCESWRVAVEANNLLPWRVVPDECAEYVRSYMTGQGYRSDLEVVHCQAAEYARRSAPADDGMDAWVFDVDETLLSNLPYYSDHGYGHELFNHLEFDKWVEKAEAPAVPFSLNLYDEVRALGFKIFLLTGRSRAHEAVTVENLNKVGFQDWDKLILRETEDKDKSAITYKSEKRDVMLAGGYRIVANLGDQWSDLLGSSVGLVSFKIPNPMYYIS